jgi:hypothetical protein
MRVDGEANGERDKEQRIRDFEVSLLSERNNPEHARNRVRLTCKLFRRVVSPSIRVLPVTPASFEINSTLFNLNSLKLNAGWRVLKDGAYI